MNIIKKNRLFFLVAASLACACGSNGSHTTLAEQSTNANSAAGGNAADANGTATGGTHCGNGNAGDGNGLTPASYQYAFFRRDDWTHPAKQLQTDLYVIITEDPNFCVANPNGPLDDTVTVSNGIPSLSVAYSWRRDPNGGPIVIDPNTYPSNVTVDTHPVDTSPYEIFENGNDRVCDLYGSGTLNSPTADTFGASASGALTIQSITPTALTFTLNATLPEYVVPAGRNEATVFSGQTVHYALQAKACRFQPEDLTKGAPNAPPAVAVGRCPAP